MGAAGTCHADPKVRMHREVSRERQEGAEPCDPERETKHRFAVKGSPVKGDLGSIPQDLQKWLSL